MIAKVVLATLAVMTYVGVPAAMAEKQITSTGPVILDGSEAGTNRISAFAGELTCAGTITTVHKYNLTPHTALPSSSNNMTLTKHRTNCKIVEGGSTHKATVTDNGCDEAIFVQNGALRTDFVCSSENSIQIEVYPFSGSELGGVVCTITIGSQSGLSGATISNGSGDLVISGTFTGLSAKRSGSACATEATTSGTIEVNETLKGTNEAGGSTEVSVS